jgi:hypothetical protein
MHALRTSLIVTLGSLALLAGCDQRPAEKTFYKRTSGAFEDSNPELTKKGQSYKEALKSGNSNLIDPAAQELRAAYGAIKPQEFVETFTISNVKDSTALVILDVKEWMVPKEFAGFTCAGFSVPLYEGRQLNYYPMTGIKGEALLLSIELTPEQAKSLDVRKSRIKVTLEVVPVLKWPVVSSRDFAIHMSVKKAAFVDLVPK